MIRFLLRILLTQETRDFFSKYFREWLRTFSNQPSFFSSKRLERALLMSIALTLMCFFVYHARNTLTAFDFMMIITPLFGYAGFSTIVQQREKVEEKLNPSPKQEIVEDPLEEEKP